MRKISCCLLILVSVFMSYAQSVPCLTDQVFNDLKAEYPQVNARMNELNDKIKSKFSSKSKWATASLPSPESILIPVVFYIVHDNTFDVSDAQVNQQLQALNDRFYDVGMRFCLANKAGNATGLLPMNSGDVQAAPGGIIHVNNPILTNHNVATDQAALRNTAHTLVKGDKYLRIWVVKSINNQSGVLGYAYMPAVSASIDGIVMRSDVCGSAFSSNMLANYNQGEVLVHEVGHWLGLYHTFEGGCSTPNNNPYLDGDLLNDTPAANAANFNCNASTNSCISLPGNDDIKNFMDYGNNVCVDHFTTEQKERMIMMLNLYRKDIYSNDNLLYTGATCGISNLVSAKISADRYTVCSNAAIVNFEGLPGLSYSWNFGDPGSGANNTSVSQNPSHTFTSAANSPYTVTLTASNGSNVATSTVKIFVNNCSPISNSDSNWFIANSSLLNFKQTGLPFFESTTNFPYTGSAGGYSAVQNDANGNLLFYTNGLKVWNNQNAVVATIAPSIFDGQYRPVQIVPNPANASEYYIFKNIYQQNTNTAVPDPLAGFSYNIVTVSGSTVTVGVTTHVTQTATFGMSASNGFSVNTSNSAVYGGGCVTAVKKCNNEYWILTPLVKGTTYFITVFSLNSANGLRYSGEYQLPLATTLYGIQYQIRISPNGNKLFVSSGTSNDTYLFDFNKSSGVLSNRLAINPTGNSLHGVFSPDSNLLYVSQYNIANPTLSSLWQYNINSANINGTGQEIMIPENTKNMHIKDMQQGPDNKVYVLFTHTTQIDELGVIHNPNILSLNTSNYNACNFSAHGPKAIFPNANYSLSALPNFIDAKQETAYFAMNSPNIISAYKVGCNKYKFFRNFYNGNCALVYKWVIVNKAAPGTVIATITEPTEAVYQFTTPGIYTVTLKNFLNATFSSMDITVSNLVAPTIQGSSTVCLSSGNNNLSINSVAVQPGQTAVWSVASGGSITGPNNQPNVTVNWTTLPTTTTPATLNLSLTDASGCVATATKTLTPLCPDCSCLPYIYFTQGANLDGGYIIRVNASNQICANLNIKNTWTINGVTSVTYGYASKGYTASGMQNFIVTTDLLAPNGSVLCSSTYNSVGSGSRLSLDYGGAGQMKVTPNPSKGLFNIAIDQLKAKVSIMVLDSNGRVIYQANDELFDNEKTIDLSTAESGLYFLKVKGQNIDYSEKIIKN